MSVDPLVPEPDTDEAEVLADASFERPNPLVCVVWLLGRAVTWVILVLVLTIVHSLGHLNAQWLQIWIFSPSVVWLIPPIYIAFPLLSYRGWGYQLRQHDLLVRRGFLTRQFVSVPLARVQQVDVSSGLFERLLGLARLVVHTAGTRAARTQIPGLSSDEAALLRDELSRKGDELAG